MHFGEKISRKEPIFEASQKFRVVDLENYKSCELI
jgi:hypothetical protein